jgi:hypothetical protein
MWLFWCYLTAFFSYSSQGSNTGYLIKIIFFNGELPVRELLIIISIFDFGDGYGNI